MRYAVTYRINGGKCQTGFAVQTCDGAKVYAAATGGEPIVGAVVVPNGACPPEVAVVGTPEMPAVDNCKGNKALLVYDECSAEALFNLVQKLDEVMVACES